MMTNLMIKLMVMVVMILVSGTCDDIGGEWRKRLQWAIMRAITMSIAMEQLEKSMDRLEKYKWVLSPDPQMALNYCLRLLYFYIFCIIIFLYILYDYISIIIFLAATFLLLKWLWIAIWGAMDLVKSISGALDKWTWVKVSLLAATAQPSTSAPKGFYNIWIANSETIITDTSATDRCSTVVLKVDVLDIWGWSGN